MKLIKQLSLCSLVALMGVQSAHADWRDLLSQTRTNVSGLYGTIASKINTGYVAVTGIGVSVACATLGLMYQFGSKNSKNNTISVPTTPTELKPNIIIEAKPEQPTAQVYIPEELDTYQPNNLEVINNNVLRLPTTNEVERLKKKKGIVIASNEPVLVVKFLDTGEHELLPYSVIEDILLKKQLTDKNEPYSITLHYSKTTPAFNKQYLAWAARYFKQNPAFYPDSARVEELLKDNILAREKTKTTYADSPSYTYTNGQKAYKFNEDNLKALEQKSPILELIAQSTLVEQRHYNANNSTENLLD